MANPSNGIKVERSSRIVTPKARASYPHVFKPSAFQGEGEPKFSISLLVPKSNEDFIKQLRGLQDAATKALYPTKKPQNFETWGITDGDDTQDSAAAGCWIVKASNKSRPAVVDKDAVQIIDELEVYGGCYVRANINAKAYGTPSKGGVTLELNVVQKIGDGDAFGGAAAVKAKAVEEMGAYEEELAEEF